ATLSVEDVGRKPTSSSGRTRASFPSNPLGYGKARSRTLDGSTRWSAAAPFGAPPGDCPRDGSPAGRSWRRTSWLPSSASATRADEDRHMETATLSVKYQLVLPRRVREHLGLR